LPDQATLILPVLQKAEDHLLKTQILGRHNAL
jgi:hypothetical protein